LKFLLWVKPYGIQSNPKKGLKLSHLFVSFLHSLGFYLDSFIKLADKCIGTKISTNQKVPLTKNENINVTTNIPTTINASKQEKWDILTKPEFVKLCDLDTESGFKSRYSLSAFYHIVKDKSAPAIK